VPEDRPINAKKFNSILALPAPKRYDHFIKQAADKAMVWGLWADGWAMVETNDDNTVCFPMWPAREYAELYRVDEWSHFQAREIDLYDVLDELLPRLRDEGRSVSVFPVPRVGGIVPALDQFETDLRAELSKIE
jgi:Protein of unknown function (DUF2750)